jgi:hypothetical protein
MPLTVLLFYTRLPEISPADFKAHMQDIYLPLIKTTFGCHQPTHIRVQFVERASSGAGDRLGAHTASKTRNPPDAPVVLVGQPADLGWDAMCEMTFQDELGLQQCLAIANGDEGQAIKEDEERFSVADQLRVVLMGQGGISVGAEA